MDLIEGSQVEHYGKLWDTCAERRRSNPGTIILMKLIEDEGSGDKSRFERLYVCLGVCKQGFKDGCRLWLVFMDVI